MDITSFVVQGRDQALLYGDYSSYHAQLSKKILHFRRKLGIVTKSRGKFQKRGPVTVDDVAQNHEYVHLLLLTSERAWSQAMTYKTTHTADEKGIVGRARSHIVSRLRRAADTANHLADILSTPGSTASRNDLLESRAYAALVRGAMLFEGRRWEECLSSYAVARVTYTALSTSAKGDLFGDLLSETIDPSVRYASYQLKTPRTVPIPTIVLKFFPRSDQSLVEAIDSIDPGILNPEDKAHRGGGNADAVPKTLTWRSREVKIEHAQIAETWGKVQEAKARLRENLTKAKDLGPRGMATAYEEVLMLTQDAVDATKEAIDELRGEGVGSGDPRMQSLQITRTAVNYEMISWRIGRNRVLLGSHDGSMEEYSSLGRKKKAKAPPTGQQEREAPISKKLSTLKERAALYDGTLQNLESIKELPGIANDTELATRIGAYEKYFEALKSLAIARSHAIVGTATNALALIDYASKLCAEATSRITEAISPGPLNVDVGREDAAFLTKLLEGQLQRHRAIVYIDNALQEEREKEEARIHEPLIERLHEYPVGGVDLNNIVTWPPKIEQIPMNPIFLDVAWNYITYPGQRAEAVDKKASSVVPTPDAQQKPTQPAKKGWFGFGK